MSSSSAELTPNANQKIVQYLNDALAMEMHQKTEYN
jgi:hypothetical protein